MPEPEEKRNNQTLEPGYRGYIAGVLDCDGAIWIASGKYKGAPKYALRISVSNTRPDLVYWFSEQFGGKPHSYKPKNPKHKEQFTWSCTGTRARDVISCCLPYLVIKRAQAILALEFASTLDLGLPALPKSHQAMRARIHTDMIELNKRGNE